MLKVANFKSKFLENCHKYERCPLKSFLEFYLVYKNACLKILRQKLQNLEQGNFDKIE